MPIARRQHGFTLLGLLFLIAGMGVAMAALGTLWHTAAQREKEKDLLFAGDQYRRAIESFWNASPKGQERLPKSFAELLEDPRFPHTVRHLRRLYPDPMTGASEWGLEKGANDGIAGVYSQSDNSPYKQSGFPARYAGFEGTTSYRDWIFQAKNVQAGSGTGGDASQAATGKDGQPAGGDASQAATGKDSPPAGGAGDTAASKGVPDQGANDATPDEKIRSCHTARRSSELTCRSNNRNNPDGYALQECQRSVDAVFDACIAAAQ